jgi:HlyD family secretion protein
MDFETDLAANTAAMHRLIRYFVASALALSIGVGGWACAAKVDSAVVTSGTFVVQSSAQAVQHLEGGVIGAILVKDGQHVDQGQVVVKLDAAKVIADTTILDRKIIDLIAQKARLDAEESDQPTIATPDLPVEGEAAAATLARALSAQQGLLTERRSTRASQMSQLAERKTQIKAQLRGLADQLASVKDEMEQAAGDLADKQTIFKKGLITRPVMRAAERDVSRLRGQIGDVESRIATAQSELAENAFKTAEASRTTRTEVLDELQSVTERLAELEQDRTAALDRLQRLEIRAPRAGIVNELTIHTVGGIVAPGQVLMSIIPTTDPLIVTAKILPEDIDQVHVGQMATVRISAFKLATPPELEGTVTGVSADKVTDERSGLGYFSVKIRVPETERVKLDGKELTPGLPAEVLIRGESRRVITYLTQPLTDKIGLAFREK